MAEQPSSPARFPRETETPPERRPRRLPDTSVELRDSADTKPTLPAPAEERLADRLREQLVHRWNRGERVRVESYLDRFPALKQDAESLLDLIYTEIVVREEHGEAPQLQEYLQRFPNFAAELRRQFDVHQALQDPDVAGGSEPETCPLPKETDATASQTGLLDPSLSSEVDASSAQTDLPAFIGSYRIVERLGTGAQGDVYRAIHPGLRRDVVVKWSRLLVSEKHGQMLLAEGRVLAGLDDPGIVRIHDVEIWQNRLLLVFEYLPGQTLADRIRQGLPSQRQAVALVAQIAATLHRAHQRGVVHRDLKPANILLTPEGEPRLLDFGLASLSRPWGQLNELPAGSLAGTLEYMAPEQARGTMDAVGPRADVFGLGAILYHLLTGRPPYQGSDLTKLLQRAQEAKLVPPRQCKPSIPRALERICLKALARSPEDRYDSAAELAAALQAYLRRPRRIAVALATAAAVLVGLGGLAWIGGSFSDWSRHLTQDATSLQSSAGTAPVPIPITPLEGELVVRVWSTRKQGLRLEEKGALPIRNGDQLQLEAHLNQPSYLFLVWVDTEGKPQALHPWNDRHILHALDSPPPAHLPRQELYSPGPDLSSATWPMEGPAGLETILLLARRTPLPADFSLKPIIGELPPTPCEEPLTLIRRAVDGGQLIPLKLTAKTRKLGAQSEDVPDPFLQMLLRLREHFEMIRAVRFAHES